MARASRQRETTREDSGAAARRRQKGIECCFPYVFAPSAATRLSAMSKPGDHRHSEVPTLLCLDTIKPLAAHTLRVSLSETGRLLHVVPAH